MRLIYLIVISMIVGNESLCLAKKGSESLYLFSYSENPREQKVDAQKKLIPNRVYIRNAPVLKKSIFTLTDATGNFGQKLEMLAVDTVLPGWMIGSKKINQKYKLNDDANWELTDDDEELVLWAADGSNQIRVFSSEDNLVTIPPPRVSQK